MIDMDLRDISSDFVKLREAWENRMLSFSEAFKLQEMENLIESKPNIQYNRVTPRRKSSEPKKNGRIRN